MGTKLWALLIPGPDEVWAMPSKDAAEDAANRHNEAIEAGEIDAAIERLNNVLHELRA